jgi:hypothetical protein
MLPRPLLYGIVIAVTLVWVASAIADIISTNYDAQGVNLLFGAIVGGLVGLVRDSHKNGKNGNGKNGNGSNGKNGENK